MNKIIFQTSMHFSQKAPIVHHTKCPECTVFVQITENANCASYKVPRMYSLCADHRKRQLCIIQSAQNVQSLCKSQKAPIVHHRKCPECTVFVQITESANCASYKVPRMYRPCASLPRGQYTCAPHNLPRPATTKSLFLQNAQKPIHLCTP